MKKNKTGRNDLCPCGSGRKYKNCCLPRDDGGPAGSSPFDRYNTIMNSLKLKLDQNYGARIKKLRPAMQERFLRLSCDRTLPREQESVFSDWLWFDLTDSNGMTFGCEYMRDHGNYMEEPLHQCLDALNHSHLSVYALESPQGESLRVKDIVTGATREVMLKEPLEPEPEQPPPLLLGRLASMPEGMVFSGMVLMLGDDKGQGDFIRRHIDYWQQIRPGTSIAELCKQNGEVLFGLFDHASHRTTLALNDIRYLPAGEQSDAIIDLIRQTAGFVPVHDTAGMTWYEYESLGPTRVGISGRGHLVFYADVIDDIIGTEEWLGFSRNSWQIINSSLLFAPPPESLGDIWYEVIKERETERWLHTPHQELDDKTPAQILAEADGENRLLSLLDEFAASAGGNPYSLDLVDYMRQRIA